jgi:methyl-accepting chemotaxis protein
MKLSVRIILFQLLVVFLIFAGFAVYEFNSTISQLETELEVSKTAVTNRLQETLVLPLWNYDTETATRIINLELTDDNFLGILVSSDGVVFGSFNMDREIVPFDESLSEMADNSRDRFTFKIFKGEEPIADVEVLLSMNKYLNKRNSFIFVLFLQIFILAAMLTLTNYLIVKLFIVKPIGDINSKVEEIAQGEGDLTKLIHVSRRDEIGDLADNFNIFVGKLKSIVLNVKGSSVNVNGVSASLGSNAEETAAAIIEMEQNISQITNQVRNLNEASTNSGDSVSNITENISDLNSLIENQTLAVEEATSSINQMSASLDNVASITKSKTESMETLKRSAERGTDNVRASDSSVNEIADSIGTISDMILIINGIAAQTNLLAMNAAIEAAHAGDSGRGFAVVADEIRKLAETSSVNAKKIGIEIKEIVQKIEAATHASRESSSSFNLINDEILEVSQALMEIASTTVELSEGGRQIITSMNALSENSGEVRMRAGSISTLSDSVLKDAQSVKRIATEVSGGMEEIRIGTGEVSLAVNNLRDITQDLEGASQSLEEEIGKFKTE